MATAENAIVYYEAGQSPVTMTALTDQGDNLTFKSADTLWSNKSGYQPIVRPNGVISGLVVTPSSTNNKVNVSAGKAYLAGVETTISASTDTLTITRGLTTDTHCINSVTINSSGALAIVTGTDHTAFSATRGAAGGPPWIPTGSIEVAQIRTTSITAAAVDDDEIYAVTGTHREQWNQPTWDEVRAEVENGVLGYDGVDFHSAMPAIHSDDSGTTTKTKKVYASYYEPEVAQIAKTSDVVPPETSHSVTSKQIYGTTLGGSSSSLGQGSFTAYLEDGISDGLLTYKDENLFFKFYADRNNDPFILAQGKLGISRTFPAGDQISAKCTITAETAALEVTG